MQLESCWAYERSLSIQTISVGEVRPGIEGACTRAGAVSGDRGAEGRDDDDADSVVRDDIVVSVHVGLGGVADGG